MRKVKVDLTGASFPSDHIRIVSAELVRTSREEEAKEYRETCLDAWMKEDMETVRAETNKFLPLTLSQEALQNV